MANNLTSNWARKLVPVFLEKFENKRVLSKAVDTQLLQGKFTPSTGANVDFKRPHDFASTRTSGGDISSVTKNSLIAGKATGTVQDYITVPVEWGDLEEAIELNQLDEILDPIADRIVTDLETSFAEYMIPRCNLKYGSPGTAVTAWTHVAGAQAYMQSIGLPMDGNAFYVMNPFVAATLASAQSGLNNDSLVKSAWEKAQTTREFGGLKVMTATTLASYTTGANADRAGTLAADPTVTYVAHKDSMTQSFSVAGFSNGGVVKAGSIITIAGRNRLNLSTRKQIFDASGNPIIWHGVVAADVTLSGTGTGTITVSGPAIYEAGGQYNTVASAPVSGDVITILGDSATTYQPNMFFHKSAYGIGTVKLPKLYSTDTIATTRDGMSIRVSRYADGDANKQMVRFDLLPAFATFNPFFAGQGFGVA